MTRDEHDKRAARERVIRQLGELIPQAKRTRAANEGIAEGLLYGAAVVISASDDLGGDPDTLRSLVDRLWETADLWVAERKQNRRATN